MIPTTITPTTETNAAREAIAAMKRGSGRGLRRTAGITWLFTPLPETRRVKVS